jgi:hypothetical protein
MIATRDDASSSYRFCDPRFAIREMFKIFHAVRRARVVQTVDQKKEMQHDEVSGYAEGTTIDVSAVIVLSSLTSGTQQERKI